MTDLSSAFVTLTAGVGFSLLAEEVLGLTCGDLLVPGVLALLLSRPRVLAALLLTALLDYLTVNFLLSRLMILYGRKKKALLVLVSLFLSLGALTLGFAPFPEDPILTLVLAVLPSMLASAFCRQGIGFTLLTVSGATALSAAAGWLASLPGGTG